MRFGRVAASPDNIIAVLWPKLTKTEDNWQNYMQIQTQKSKIQTNIRSKIIIKPRLLNPNRCVYFDNRYTRLCISHFWSRGDRESSIEINFLGRLNNTSNPKTNQIGEI